LHEIEKNIYIFDVPYGDQDVENMNGLPARFDKPVFAPEIIKVECAFYS